jgi:hypothetical protein
VDRNIFCQSEIPFFEEKKAETEKGLKSHFLSFVLERTKNGREKEDK